MNIELDKIDSIADFANRLKIPFIEDYDDGFESKYDLNNLSKVKFLPESIHSSPKHICYFIKLKNQEYLRITLNQIRAGYLEKVIKYFQQLIKKDWNEEEL